MIVSVTVLLLVSLQRLGELVLARRNTARLMREGAVEVAPGHYGTMVLMHSLWLVGLWVLASDRPVIWGWLALYAALQPLRIWILASLGPRWTTRIIVKPGAALVRRGPYRFVSHPNYLVVIAEIAVLPLVFGLVWYAVVFSILNGAILRVRIGAENAALARSAPA